MDQRATVFASDEREHASFDDVAGQLLPGETLRDDRVDAMLVRIDNARSSEPRNGQLYLTDRRLLHLDGETVAIDLTDIEELTLAGDRLLITLSGLHGLVIDTTDAAEFRAAVAAAINALRSHTPSR